MRLWHYSRSIRLTEQLLLTLRCPGRDHIRDRSLSSSRDRVAALGSHRQAKTKRDINAADHLYPARSACRVG
jgi:hypothetical protein